MIEGPVVAIMFFMSCGLTCNAEYVAPYKDMKTCYERVLQLKKTDTLTRYCRLEAVIQTLDYDFSTSH